MFRYDLAKRVKLHAFRPKDLPNDADLLNLRASVFGARFNSCLEKLICSDNVSVIWEAPSAHPQFTPSSVYCLVQHLNSMVLGLLLQQVSVGEAVPATVHPTKPKYYILCNTTIPAATAAKLV